MNLLRVARRSSQLQSIIKRYDKLAQLRNIQKSARVEYMKYPYLEHQDPKSKSYLQDDVTEHYEKSLVQSYNRINDEFKKSIETQTQVWEMLKKLDRPYLRGRKGIDCNLYDEVKDYGKLGDIGFKRAPKDVEPGANNEDWWIYQARWHLNGPTPQCVKDLKEQKLKREVNPNFNRDKGSKYDVEWKEHQKHEYLADRLGHPETIGTPFERMLRLEKDLYHPAMLDQPYVKMPSANASETLNFARGPIVYENKHVEEWGKLGFYGMSGTLLFLAGYIPYISFYKSHGFSNSAFDNSIVPFHNFTIHYMDTLKLHVLLAPLLISLAYHLTMKLFHQYASSYAVRLTLSEDKELLFVTSVGKAGSLEEKVYEMAHLEILPPSIKSGVQYLSAYDQNGIWRIVCQSTQECILVNNDQRCWNSAQRKQFFSRVTNLWDQTVLHSDEVAIEDEATGRIAGK